MNSDKLLKQQVKGKILRLYNTIQYTHGPRDSPHRVGSGSSTGPLDFESPGPVLDS